MSMNLKTQEYICALADTGSYSKAAQKLYISQPTLSISVKKIEESLGVALFTKVNQRIVPTYIGEKYIEKSRKMLALEKEFDEELGYYKNGSTGLLRIGVTLIMSPVILPGLLSAFVKRYPNVELKTVEENSSDLIPMLEQSRLDVILCNVRERPENFGYISLKKDHLLVALPPGNPANEHARFLSNMDFPWLDLKHLENNLFIVQKKNQNIRRYIDHALEYCQVSPLKMMEISITETAAQMAAEGIGVAFCMENYIKTFQTKKPLNFFLTGDINQYADFCLLYRHGIEDTDYFKEFVRLTKSLL